MPAGTSGQPTTLPLYPFRVSALHTCIKMRLLYMCDDEAREKQHFFNLLGTTPRRRLSPSPAANGKMKKVKNNLSVTSRR